MACFTRQQARRRSTHRAVADDRCPHRHSTAMELSSVKHVARGDGLGRAGAAALITEVAAVIPSPGESLWLDEESWNGFDRLLDDAAGLVATVIGDDGASILRDLVASPVGEEPMQLLLLERVIGHLDGRSA